MRSPWSECLIFPPFRKQSFIPLFHSSPGCLGNKVHCALAADLAWLGDGLLPSANSFFIRNLWFNGDGKADAGEESEIWKPMLSLYWLQNRLKMWRVIIFQLKLLMLGNVDLGQLSCFPEFCSACEVTSAGASRIKTNVYTYVLCLFGNYFRWKLVSFYFLEVFKPLSRIQLFAFKCNPRFNLYQHFAVCGERGLPANWTSVLITQCTDHCLEWGCVFCSGFIFPSYIVRPKLFCNFNTSYWRTVDRSLWMGFSITCIYAVMGNLGVAFTAAEGLGRAIQECGHSKWELFDTAQSLEIIDWQSSGFLGNGRKQTLQLYANEMCRRMLPLLQITSVQCAFQ